MKNIHKAIFAGTVLFAAAPAAFADCTSHILATTVKWNEVVPLSKSARIVAETGPDYGAVEGKNAHPSCIESAPLPAGNAPVKISAWGIPAISDPAKNPAHVAAGKVIRVYVKSEGKKYPATIISGGIYPVGPDAKKDSDLSVTVP